MKVSVVVIIIAVILLLALLCLLSKRYPLKGGLPTTYKSDPKTLAMMQDEKIIDRVTDMLLTDDRNRCQEYLNAMWDFREAYPFINIELSAFVFGKDCIEKANAYKQQHPYVLVPDSGYHIAIPAVEAYVAMYRVHNISLKCLNVLGCGGFNCAFDVEMTDLQTKNVGRMALRLYIDHGSWRTQWKRDPQTGLLERTNSKVLENGKAISDQFRAIRDEFQGKPFFPIIAYASTDFKHVDDLNSQLNIEIVNYCYWMISPIYKFNLNDYLVRRPQYARALIDAVKCINGSGYVYFDWKAPNMLYDASNNVFRLTDIEMTKADSPNITKTHNTNELFTRRNVKEACRDPELAKLLDKLIVLKEIHDITEHEVADSNGDRQPYSKLVNTAIKWTDLTAYFGVYIGRRGSSNPLVVEYKRDNVCEVFFEEVYEECKRLKV